MFAVSENICIFVLPRIAYFTDSRITYKESVYSAGSLSDNSIAVGLRFLAEHSERARPFSFIYTVINFFQKMPRIEKVSSTKVNNSNLSAQSTHKFRVKISNYLSKNPKLCANVFGYSKILSIFVVPNKLIHSINPIDSLYFRYKAGFSGLSYFRVDSLFGDIKEGLAHSLLLSTVKY